MQTDPIADYLTRIRNALRSGHDEVEIPSSGLKLEMSRMDGKLADAVSGSNGNGNGEAMAAAATAEAPSGDPIKVMTVTTLNAAGPTYQNIANTAEAYEQYINARGPADLLTLRAARALSAADVLACDPDAHVDVLALARRDSTLSNYVPDLLERWERPDSATVIPTASCPAR